MTPDTLLRWYRRLVAKKYDGTSKRARSRPRRSVDIVELVLRMAKENSTWGYTRIRGALFNLGHELGRNTIKRVLLEAGIEPAPERSKRMSWSAFLRAHWGAIAAMDFFTVEVVTWVGLNAYAERWIGSARRECLAQVIPLGERHLRKLVSEFVAHYHSERNHQGLGNNLVVPMNNNAANSGRIVRRKRLGGVLNYYHREAA